MCKSEKPAPEGVYSMYPADWRGDAFDAAGDAVEGFSEPVKAHEATWDDVVAAWRELAAEFGKIVDRMALDASRALKSPKRVKGARLDYVLYDEAQNLPQSAWPREEAAPEPASTWETGHSNIRADIAAAKRLMQAEEGPVPLLEAVTSHAPADERPVMASTPLCGSHTGYTVPNQSSVTCKACKVALLAAEDAS